MFGAPGGGVWTPSPEEAPYLDALWTIADADKTGKIAGQAAVAFFKLSGQPVTILREVWAVADSKQQHSLSKPEFLVAMRLISMAQVNGLFAPPSAAEALPAARVTDSHP